MVFKELFLLCALSGLVWSYQWAKQSELDHKAATVPLGASYELIHEILGEPSEIHQTEGTGVYCYSCGFPFKLVHPEEWQFEFQQGTLIAKRSSSTRPEW